MVGAGWAGPGRGRVRDKCTARERHTARDGREEAVGERREEERAAEHHEGQLVTAELPTAQHK